MYLLTDRDSLETVQRELKGKIETVLYADKDSKGESTVESILRRAVPEERLIDLSPTTRAMLLELQGKPGYYRKNHYGDRLSSRTKMEIGRAMVLADREFGLLDEVVLDLFQKTFMEHSGSSDLSFSSPSTLTGAFGYSHLKMILSTYFSELEPFPYSLRWNSNRGAINLELGIDSRGKLCWFARGKSKFIAGHREIVAELNAALGDYDQRLQWMANYRHSDPKPGLDSRTLTALRSALRVYYRRPFDLSGLEPGVSFGDDPIILAVGSEEDKTRGYFARCIECGLPAYMEIVSSYGFYMRNSTDWASSNDTFSNKLPEDSASTILLRCHRRTGCEGQFAKSSRTANKISIS